MGKNSKKEHTLLVSLQCQLHYRYTHYLNEMKMFDTALGVRYGLVFHERCSVLNILSIGSKVAHRLPEFESSLMRWPVYSMQIVICSKRKIYGLHLDAENEGL